MELRFVESESTFIYFESTKRYLQNYGKPIAFYSDKLSVFRVNEKDAKAGDQVTQFSRALSDLNIDIICANTWFRAITLNVSASFSNQMDCYFEKDSDVTILH